MIYVLYVVFLIIFSIYSWFVLSNLQELGYVGDATRSMIMIYLTFSSVIIIVSVIFLLIGRGVYA